MAPFSGSEEENKTSVPPAHTLLFEDEYVRVWEMVLEPGETYPSHEHEYRYLSLVIEGAPLVLIGADGTEEPVAAAEGAVLWRDSPDVHGVRNVGQTRFRNRLVEIKEG